MLRLKTVIISVLLHGFMDRSMRQRYLRMCTGKYVLQTVIPDVHWIGCCMLISNN